MEPIAFASQIAHLREHGWSCHWHSQPIELPSPLLIRYPWLPNEYLDFVCGLDECVNPDETQWLLAPADFDPREHHAWTHDEWERLSLNSANGNATLITEIKRFWDAHLPICLGVGGEYSYYALRVGDGSGAVVSGRGPEFEDASEFAANFTQFLSHLT